MYHIFYLFFSGAKRVKYEVKIFTRVSVFPRPQSYHSVDREARLVTEDHWIETLRTSYLYSLNEKEEKANPTLPVGCSFPHIQR